MGILKHLFCAAIGGGEYEKGIADYNQHRYLEAIAHFETVLNETSTCSSLNRNLARFYCAQAHRNLGIIRFAAGNFTDSLNEFHNALALNKEHADLYYFIGICHNNLRDFEKAAEAFNHLLEIDPDHLSTKLKLAIAFHNSGRWEKSVSIYQRILDENPTYADVHYHLGLALIGTGRALEALRAFKAALDINPHYLAASVKYCITLTHLGKFDEAFAGLSGLIQKHPEYPDLLYYISIVHAGKNEPLQAIDRLKQAIHINPNYRDARIKLSLLYCQEGEFSSALRQLEAIEFDGAANKDLESAKRTLRAVLADRHESPETVLDELLALIGNDKPLAQIIGEFNKSVDITLNFSEMVSLIEKYDGAKTEGGLWEMLLPLTLEYIKQHPGYADLYETLGILYQRLNRAEDAIEAFKQAITINPGYLKARINLFKALKQQGNIKEALEHGRYLAEVNQIRYPDVLTATGEIYFEMERFAASLEKAEAVLAEKPDFIPAVRLSAQALEHLGRYEESTAAYRQLMNLTSSPQLRELAQTAISRLGNR